MGLDKMINKLGELLTDSETPAKKRRKKLRKVLHDLNKKEAKIQDKLESASDKRKRERLKKELEIVKQQHALGQAALDEASVDDE